MKSKRYKSLKSFYYYQLLAWTILLGSFAGYYYLMTEFLHLSTEFSLTIILSTVLIISSSVISLFQVVYKENFSIEKIYLFDKYFLKLSNFTIKALQYLLIVLTVVCIGYSITQIMTEKNMLFGICIALIGFIIFLVSIPLWRYTIYKRIEFYD